MSPREHARTGQRDATVEDRQSREWMQTYINSESKEEADAAFAALFQRWEKELKDYLMWQLWARNQQKYRSKEEAEPEADEILVEVFRNLMGQRYHPTFKPEKSFRGWLFTIAERRLIDHLRRQRKTEEVENWDLVKADARRSGSSHGLSPEARLSNQDFYADLREFCLGLDERERVYLFLAKSGLGHMQDEGVVEVLQALWESFSLQRQEQIREQVGDRAEIKNIEIAELFDVVPAVVARIARRLEDKFAAFLKGRRKELVEK